MHLVPLRATRHMCTLPQDIAWSMLGCMRTTLTLDDDVAILLKRLSEERQVSFRTHGQRGITGRSAAVGGTDTPTGFSHGARLPGALSRRESG